MSDEVFYSIASLPFDHSTGAFHENQFTGEMQLVSSDLIAMVLPPTVQLTSETICRLSNFANFILAWNPKTMEEARAKFGNKTNRICGWTRVSQALLDREYQRETKPAAWQPMDESKTPTVLSVLCDPASKQGGQGERQPSLDFEFDSYGALTITGFGGPSLTHRQIKAFHAEHGWRPLVVAFNVQHENYEQGWSFGLLNNPNTQSTAKIGRPICIPRLCASPVLNRMTDGIDSETKQKETKQKESKTDSSAEPFADCLLRNFHCPHRISFLDIYQQTNSDTSRHQKIDCPVRSFIQGDSTMATIKELRAEQDKYKARDLFRSFRTSVERHQPRPQEVKDSSTRPALAPRSLSPRRFFVRQPGELRSALPPIPNSGTSISSTASSSTTATTIAPVAVQATAPMVRATPTVQPLRSFPKRMLDEVAEVPPNKRQKTAYVASNSTAVSSTDREQIAAALVRASQFTWNGYAFSLTLDQWLNLCQLPLSAANHHLVRTGPSTICIVGLARLVALLFNMSPPANQSELDAFMKRSALATARSTADRERRVLLSFGQAYKIQGAGGTLETRKDWTTAGRLHPDDLPALNLDLAPTITIQHIASVIARNYKIPIDPNESVVQSVFNTIKGCTYLRAPTGLVFY